MDRFPFSLSLYAIVSKDCASKYLERALNSFIKLKPDEIVLCGAMGKYTEEGKPILEEVGKKFNAKIVWYENSPIAKDWEYLDSFANARNKALDACTSEWSMWFDADDLLIDGAENMLFKIAEKVKDHECIYFGYSVPIAGLCPIRERITKKGTFRWIYAVHEQLKPVSNTGAKAIGVPAPAIVHAPHGYKGSSADRNHLILDKELSQSGMYTFYKAEEYFLAGKWQEAIQWARQAIANPSLDILMRVQCHTIIGRCLADPVLKREELFKAYALQPNRIEALHYIAEDYFNRKLYREALALARSACSIQRPNEAYWTTKDIIYSWEAPDLYERCAKAIGDKQLFDFLEAEKVRNFGEIDITLCHATARLSVAKQIRNHWFSMAKEPNRIQHIMGVDEANADLAGYDYVVANPSGCVGAWNECAKNAKGKYIVQLSDDFLPPYGWDEEIRKRLPDPEKPAVLSVSDGHRKDDLLCIAICTKKTLDYLGGNLFHPEYARCSGIFSDNEFTLRTKEIQVDAKDLVFQHNNPIWTGAEGDDIFKKHNRQENYILGEQIFRSRNT